MLWREHAFDHRHALAAKYCAVAVEAAGQVAAARACLIGSEAIAAEAVRPIWCQHRMRRAGDGVRSEEHTSELLSLMRISYAVFCLKKKNTKSQLQTATIDTTHRRAT